MTLRSAERLRAAEEVIEQLRTELREMGVTLPSLRVDPVSLASDDPYPLVDLGRCNLDTAMRLAVVLHQVRS
ncbi:hypothetical protein [Streptomyces albipurpureus]|uniref:Secreted protein n=1 Tax=Streptomyces albipurpureus TaxID=2897419 RepID=A0ABT0UV04_9ACTN|nr:hypothetical protein [Streptomyces sp. CWNU-1]MCM2391809.1 hypothetical protein [Streptomyces sp. CWNU-1]